MKKFIFILVLLNFIFSINLLAEDYAGWVVGRKDNGYGSIFGSIDSGITWNRQGSNQIVDVSINGVLAVDSLTAWTVGDVHSNYATIYNTVDGGDNWVRKGFGQNALQGISLGKVHVSSNNIWAVGINAILLSSDNGVSWTNCLPIKEYKDHIFQGVFSIDGNIAWVTGGATNPNDFAIILKTTDSGKSWVRQTNGAITTANHILGISAANSNTLWAVGGDDFLVLKSDNGGDLWTKQNTAGGLGDANEVYAVDTQTVWVAVDTLVEWTNDGGNSWSNKTTIDYTMGMCAVNKNEAWAAVDQGYQNMGYIYHTSNGGETWDEQVFTNHPFWNISFALDPVPEPGFIFLIFNFIFLIILSQTAKNFYKKSKS